MAHDPAHPERGPVIDGLFYEKNVRQEVECQCGHVWEALGAIDGPYFTTFERCPECDAEQN